MSADALREWCEVVEHVLRGIAHSLNNRASALVAVLELARDPDEEWSGTSSILGSELERVQELVQVTRTLGTAGADAEAFLPADAAATAARVLAFHAGLRERTIETETSAAPPARAARGMFIRALVCLVADASLRAAPGDPLRLTLSAGDEDDWIAVRVSGAAGPSTSRCAAELAAGMGGEMLPGVCGFRVPALAAVRRREGR